MKKALQVRYQRVEDLDKISHSIEGLKEGEIGSVQNFVKRFTKLWEQLCKALLLKQPLAMMKNDLHNHLSCIS